MPGGGPRGGRTPFVTPKNEDAERVRTRSPLLILHSYAMACHPELASPGWTARLGAAQQPCRQTGTRDRQTGEGLEVKLGACRDVTDAVVTSSTVTDTNTCTAD